MLTTYEADLIAEEIGKRREFRDRFTRNVRGNLSTRINDRLVTVFRKRFGAYAWVILNGDKLRYSPKVFKTEDDALMHLYEELECDKARCR